ncbi:MAG: 4'-phosphopantetheinyl transferase superfamily protein [Bacteroidetes bacterium]|nr:MAG: 4'-phosphopantetheinyl transferase superfamily protein [Bacteroidota bacterium]
MAIVKTLTPHENTFLLVWKITEDAETLKKLVHRVNDTHSANAQKHLHWFASRAALAVHFGGNTMLEIAKDQFNKPSLKVGEQAYHLSITHSNNYAAVLFSKTYLVALDIEKVDNRIGRVSHKFMNAAELEMLAGELNPVNAQTLIWSGKETLYKYYGQKELDFKQHMTIFTNKQYPSANPVKIRGCLHKFSPAFYDIMVDLIDEDFILTYIVDSRNNLS